MSNNLCIIQEAMSSSFGFNVVQPIKSRYPCVSKRRIRLKHKITVCRLVNDFVSKGGHCPIIKSFDWNDAKFFNKTIKIHCRKQSRKTKNHLKNFSLKDFQSLERRLRSSTVYFYQIQKITVK